MQLTATNTFALSGRPATLAVRGIRILAIGLMLLRSVPVAGATIATSNEVYVWQRVWTPAVSSALADAAPYSDGWRVLVAETENPSALRTFAVNWNALARSHKKVIGVIRIDGQIALGRQPALLEQIKARLPSLRSRGIAGIEIDHDCGVARLRDYASFLKRLRAVAPDFRISITALPAWLDSSDLDAVLADADEAVLQVHAVRAPNAGLFDPDVARNWIAAFDRRDPKPFRIALPDYGTRVLEDQNGRILSIESESPRLLGDVPARELMASPQAVAKLLQDLRANPRSRLAGYVWFRLPTDADMRIWSSQTLRAVIGGVPLKAMIGVRTRPGVFTGMSDIMLVNEGDVDAALPGWIDLPAGCRYADGVNGYSLGKNPQQISLMRLQSGLLRAHHERIVGWMRCSGGEGIHVRP